MLVGAKERVNVFIAFQRGARSCSLAGLSGSVELNMAMMVKQRARAGEVSAGWAL